MVPDSNDDRLPGSGFCKNPETDARKTYQTSRQNIFADVKKYLTSAKTFDIIAKHIAEDSRCVSIKNRKTYFMRNLFPDRKTFLKQDSPAEGILEIFRYFLKMTITSLSACAGREVFRIYAKNL